MSSLHQTRLSSRRSDLGGTVTSATKSEPKTSGRVEANGLDYYYEIHGEGEPLLLLHGGLGSTDMFGPLLPMLAEQREVIGVDLQGHGRTALGDRRIDLGDMGEDMAIILDRVGYEQVDVMGYSLGGGVGSGSPSSIRTRFAVWCSCPRAIQRTDSIPRYGHSRKR